MNPLTGLALAAMLLAQSSPLLAQDPPPPPRLMRGDISGTVGWVGINKSSPYTSNDWHSQFGVSLGAGWYWTNHHKTEVDIGATTSTTVYTAEQILVAPQQQTFRTTFSTYESQRVTVTQLYQFRRNEWVHPFLGAGLDIVREQRSRRDDPLFSYDPISRQSRPVREAVDYGQRSEILARGVLTAGVKAYLSRTVFALTDLRVGVGSRRVEDVQWRFGLGADF